MSSLDDIHKHNSVPNAYNTHIQCIQDTCGLHARYKLCISCIQDAYTHLRQYLSTFCVHHMYTLCTLCLQDGHTSVTSPPCCRRIPSITQTNHNSAGIWQRTPGVSWELGSYVEVREGAARLTSQHRHTLCGSPLISSPREVAQGGQVYDRVSLCII